MIRPLLIFSALVTMNNRLADMVAMRQELTTDHALIARVQTPLGDKALSMAQAKVPAQLLPAH